MKTPGMQKVNNGLYIQNWSCFNLLAAHQTLSTKRFLLIKNKKGNGQSSESFSWFVEHFCHLRKGKVGHLQASQWTKEINLVLIAQNQKEGGPVFSG